MAINAESEVTLPDQRGVCLDVDRSAVGWAFGSPQDAHFAFGANIEVDDRPPMPPNLASHRSPWQVGFVQNVVSEALNLRYDNMALISAPVTIPCLDASPASTPWFCGRINGVLHFGQVQGVNSFWYQGPGKPVRFRISMADWPRFAVFNFFGGGSYPTSAGRQIRSVECTRHYRTWIAAREEMSPPNLAASYILLQMIDFAIKVTITLGPNGANPLFKDEYRAAHAGTNQQLPAFANLNVDAEYGALVRGSFVRRSLSWGPPSPRIQPVVVPPVANEFYAAQIHAQNGRVSPQSLSLTAVTRCLP